MTENKEWNIKQNTFNTYQNYTIREGARYVGECDRLQDTKLIVTAVNSCKSINKDNPQVVAESIEEMCRLVKLVDSISGRAYSGIIELSQKDYYKLKELSGRLLNKLEEK